MIRLRKDIKVTNVPFGIHARRFPVECTEHRNKLIPHFDIFTYGSSTFTFDSRIIEYLLCNIGLQLHPCFINFDLVNFREN